MYEISEHISSQIHKASNKLNSLKALLSQIPIKYQINQEIAFYTCLTILNL